MKTGAARHGPHLPGLHSTAPHGETNKEGPRVAARVGQELGSPDRFVVIEHSSDTTGSSVCWPELGSVMARLWLNWRPALLWCQWGRDYQPQAEQS